jgi:hypothetical protein
MGDRDSHLMFRSERVELRLSQADLIALDRVRGPTSRSAYLRYLIHKADNAFVDDTHVWRNE